MLKMDLRRIKGRRTSFPWSMPAPLPPPTPRVPEIKLPRITEKEFQAQVMELARIFGWLHYHPWLSIKSEKGFPDLTLVRPPRVVFVELKTLHGRVSKAQRRWLDALAACPGVELYLWRPTKTDWKQIKKILR